VEVTDDRKENLLENLSLYHRALIRNVLWQSQYTKYLYTEWWLHARS